ILFSLVSSETSVITLRLMRPPVRTTGVKISPTPNFLNSTDGGHVAQLPGIGNGNSPPTRKCAVSPEMAVKFGSARVRTMPARSMALIVAVIFGVARLRKFGFVSPDTGNVLWLLKLTTVLP